MVYTTVHPDKKEVDMTVAWREDGKPIFSKDHQYKSIIWLVNDVADVPFLDYIDRGKVYGLKATNADFKKLKAAAAVYILPELRNVSLTAINRTLWWGSSTLQTSDTLSRILDIGMTSMLENLAPDEAQWEVQLTKCGPEPFSDITLLRAAFPELLAQEGERIGNIVAEYASFLQKCKTTGRLERGNGHHKFGTAAMFTLIGPLMGAAIAHLTGSWPERPLGASDIFELTFIGPKLVEAKHQWIELNTGISTHPVS